MYLENVYIDEIDLIGFHINNEFGKSVAAHNPGITVERLLVVDFSHVYSL